MSSTADHVSCTAAQRGDAIDQLTALIGAVQAELSTLVVTADEAGDWKPDGATDMAAWLVARCAITTPHAREIVRVARALADLPALRAALAAGVLSWDQVRPATRFATAATDATLARDLVGLSAAQVEALARQHRPKTDDDDRQAHARRHLSWRPDHGAGGFSYRGFLPADMAASVNEMLTNLADKAGPDPATGLWEPFATRCADALHHLATGDRTDTLVVLHVDADVVAGAAEGNGLLDPMAVSRCTVLRHLCDAAIEHSVDGPDGTSIGISRRSQAVPRWLRRHITHRDRCCRFPGCERKIRQVHHVRHWTRDLGPTDSPNLAGLCWHHHHLVHEGRWTITGNADGQLTFTSPHSRTMTSRRQPLQPRTRQRVTAATGLLGGSDLEVETVEDASIARGPGAPRDSGARSSPPCPRGP